MANIATNEAIVVFKNPITEDDRLLFIKDFNENVGEIISDYVGANDNELIQCIELSFESRWSEPKDELEKLADDYKCSIHGVCYEWGCLYVNHYNIFSS